MHLCGLCSIHHTACKHVHNVHLVAARDISQLQNAENQEHVTEPRQPTVTVHESALALDAFLPSNKETFLQKQQNLLLSKLEVLQSRQTTLIPFTMQRNM